MTNAKVYDVSLVEGRNNKSETEEHDSQLLKIGFKIDKQTS
jgi:hypothetical protein